MVVSSDAHAASIIILVPFLFDHDGWASHGTRHQSLAAIVCRPTNLTITLSLFFSTGHTIECPIREDTTSVALPKLTGSTSLRLPQQERDMVLRLSRMHIQSRLYSRVRPSQAPQEAQQELLLLSRGMPPSYWWGFLQQEGSSSTRSEAQPRRSVRLGRVRQSI